MSAPCSDSDPHIWRQALKAHMARANLSARKLSLRAGLNAAAVRDLLVGRSRSPRYETLVKLARALGVSPQEFACVPSPSAHRGEDAHWQYEVLTAFFKGIASSMAHQQRQTQDSDDSLSMHGYPAPCAIAEQVIDLIKEMENNLQCDRAAQRKAAFDAGRALIVPQ